jgi:ceramide glucosyltransferase
MELTFATSAAAWIGHVCLAAATLGCVYLMGASVLALRFGRQSQRAAIQHVPVTVLKPLHGEEPDLLPRLAALCRQNYTAPIQIIFGTQDRSDPAIDVVKQLQANFPNVDIELHVDQRAHGSNRKISNLANMAAHMRHPYIVMADSDIEVGPDYLSEVVSELQRPGVGAVTCFYHGVPAGGASAHLAALAVHTHFLPNVILATSLGLARPCFGATIALRRETLDRIGGLASFADCLADDYAIGEAVRAESAEVVFAPFSVGHVCAQRGLRDLLADEVRQARTIKTIDPVGHLGSVISHPLPLALIAWLLGSETAPLVAVLAVAIRVALCLCVEHRFGLLPQSYWLLPVRDLISFAVFVSSFFGAAVSWRGHRYHALSDGTLIQDPS